MMYVYFEMIFVCFILTYFVFIFRLLVSASQDGKLIIWDSYTTNKVELFIIHINNSCIISVFEGGYVDFYMFARQNMKSSSLFLSQTSLFKNESSLMTRWLLEIHCRLCLSSSSSK